MTPLHSFIKKLPIVSSTLLSMALLSGQNVSLPCPSQEAGEISKSPTSVGATGLGARHRCGPFKRHTRRPRRSIPPTLATAAQAPRLFKSIYKVARLWRSAKGPDRLFDNLHRVQCLPLTVLRSDDLNAHRKSLHALLAVEMLELGFEEKRRL